MWLVLKNVQYYRKMFIFVFLITVISLSSSSTIQQTQINIRTIRQTPNQASTSSCVCVPYYYCNSDNIVITNGMGLIDVRQGRAPTRMNPDMVPLCEDDIEICCRLPEPSDDLPKCGIRHENKLHQFIPRLDRDEADSGEFPWMVTIFREKTVQRNNETKKIKVYQCQGSLISERVVLTSGQCIVPRSKSGNSSGEPLSIRVGQLDTMLTNDESMYQEHNVKKYIIHKKYNANKLQNNIALLVLNASVIINKFVDITCLAGRNDVIDEDKCLLIGWDKYLGPEDSKTQKSQTNILKRRNEPYVKSSACERQLRNTPLGKRFKLDNCSICAGGSSGKNFCTNEIGAPLSCPLKNAPTQYVQVGVASWCIKSGNLQTPGIYTSIMHLRGWIDTQLAKLHLDTSAYRAARQ